MQRHLWTCVQTYMYKGYGRFNGSLCSLWVGKALKENIKVPIQIHTHYTSGVASMTYLKAIEAGCDVVDAISPLALGTSQPPTESMVATLKDSKYDTGLDLNKLNEIAEYFKPLREEYLESGL